MKRKRGGERERREGALNGEVGCEVRLQFVLEENFVWQMKKKEKEEKQWGKGDRDGISTNLENATCSSESSLQSPHR